MESDVKRRISPDELSFLYQQIGKAVWHLQYVEESLGYFYCIKGMEPYSISEKDADKKLKTTQAQTLGSLINEIEKKNLTSDFLLTALKTLNKERRWLIHKSLIENGDELYTDIGRERTFNRINNFISEAIRLQKQVSSEITRYCVSKGISEAWINSNAAKEIRKLAGEAKEDHRRTDG